MMIIVYPLRAEEPDDNETVPALDMVPAPETASASEMPSAPETPPVPSETVPSAPETPPVTSEMAPALDMVPAAETASASEMPSAPETPPVPSETVPALDMVPAAETASASEMPSVPETPPVPSETVPALDMVPAAETASASETPSVPETPTAPSETAPALEMIPASEMPSVSGLDSGESAQGNGDFGIANGEDKDIASLDSSWNITLDGSTVEIDDIQMLCAIGNCMDMSTAQLKSSNSGGSSIPGTACSPGNGADTVHAHEDRDLLVGCSPLNGELINATYGDPDGDPESLGAVMHPKPASEAIHNGLADGVEDMTSFSDHDQAPEQATRTDQDREHDQATRTANKKRARTSKEQIVAYAAKHTVLPPPSACTDERCPNGCRVRVNEALADRHVINKEVNHMSAEARREWFRAHVHDRGVNRRRKRGHGEMEGDADNTEGSRRTKTLEWCLPAGEKKVKVCKGFFLTSVGLHPNNDTPVRNALDQSTTLAVAPRDRRGRGMATNKCDHDAMKTHIFSYAPAAPHYRYLHAPKRRYLPPELSIRKMHSDFTRNGERKCSLETYRKVFKDLNIGFTQLSNEECETCKLHELHKEDCETHGNEGGECDTCTLGCGTFQLFFEIYTWNR